MSHPYTHKCKLSTGQRLNLPVITVGIRQTMPRLRTFEQAESHHYA